VTSTVLLIGLTGSIGMGKTTTAKMFESLDVPVFDADAAVHRLYEPGGAAVLPIAEAFPECLARNSGVDRLALAARVSGDPDALECLEKIVHPLVAEEQRHFIDRAVANGAHIVVLDIPLLFETGGNKRLDAVVVVSAPEDVQRSRVLARPGMTEQKLLQLMARQMPDSEKRAQAHFVVETDKGFDHAFAQVREIVSALRGRREGQRRA
jgi:dephospho-CoA kinase